MGEDTRQMLAAAIAADDAARASFERDVYLRGQQQQKQRSGDFGLVYKTRTTERTTQRSTAMDAATQAQWDSWCDARIVAMFAPDGVLHDAMAETISLIRSELRAEFRKELAAETRALREEVGALRVDAAISRSVLKGEINGLVDLTKKKVRA
jgi:hypothetical protein